MKNCVSHCAGDTFSPRRDLLCREFYNTGARFQDTGWKEAVPKLPQLVIVHLKEGHCNLLL